MKKLFSIFVALVAVMSLNAQLQIATLSSGDSIQTFYGIDALQSAYDAASDGDVITLSAGEFKSVTWLSKSLTLRGAGMGTLSKKDSVQQDRTIIRNECFINKSNITIEGIHFIDKAEVNDGENVQLIKCQFIELRFWNGKNPSIIHCFAHKFSSNIGAVCVSSYLKNYEAITYAMATTLVNCVVEVYNPIDALKNDYITNSIIIATNSEDTSNNYTQNHAIYNSLWVGTISEHGVIYQGPLAEKKTNIPANDYYIETPFVSAYEQNNHVFSGDSVFVEGTFYELTEAAKQYKGTDGKELGIYGGNLPFDATPSVPQITKFDVAPKTDADGKLSVTIEISQP